jgi:hypothetical protein
MTHDAVASNRARRRAAVPRRSTTRQKRARSASTEGRAASFPRGRSRLRRAESVGVTDGQLAFRTTGRRRAWKSLTLSFPAVARSIGHMWREATTGKPGGDRQSDEAKESIGDNITNAPKPERGTSLSYTLDRLKRSAPKQFKRVVAPWLYSNCSDYRNIEQVAIIATGDDCTFKLDNGLNIRKHVPASRNWSNRRTE